MASEWLAARIAIFSADNLTPKGNPMNAIFLVTPNGAGPENPSENVHLAWNYRTMVVPEFTVAGVKLVFENFFDPTNVVVTEDGPNFRVECVNYWANKEVLPVTVYIDSTGCGVTVAMLQNGAPEPEGE